MSEYSADNRFGHDYDLHFRISGRWRVIDVQHRLAAEDALRTWAYVWRTAEAVGVAPHQFDYLVAEDYAWYMNRALSAARWKGVLDER